MYQLMVLEPIFIYSLWNHLQSDIFKYYICGIKKKITIKKGYKL